MLEIHNIQVDTSGYYNNDVWIYPESKITLEMADVALIEEQI